jgi:hypothetical protein
MSRGAGDTDADDDDLRQGSGADVAEAAGEPATEGEPEDCA